MYGQGPNKATGTLVVSKSIRHQCPRVTGSRSFRNRDKVMSTVGFGIGSLHMVKIFGPRRRYTGLMLEEKRE